MKKTTRHKKLKIVGIILASLLVLIITARLLLPSFILKHVNKELQNIEGYTGSVKDIDLSIFGGSYSIKEIELNKTGGKIPVPFFAAERLDFSIEWKVLFKAIFRQGKIVGEIEATKPVLNYVKGPTKATTQTRIDNDWMQVVDNLMPLRINRFEIKNGEIHYRDFHSTPKVDMEISDVNIVATNLTNVESQEKLLPSQVSGTAKVYEGEAKLDMKINPLHRTPMFDMNLELTAMNLVNLNDFLRAYGNFDVQKGTFSLYTEAATRNNRIVGYAKPIIKDIDVAAWKKEEGHVLQAAWETVVEIVSWIFKNQPKDQLATQVQFEGSIKNPDIDIWSLIGQTLKNAFIKALMPSIENSVSIGTVNKVDVKGGGDISIKEKNKEEKKKEGFFKRLFKKKDDKKKKEKS